MGSVLLRMVSVVIGLTGLSLLLPLFFAIYRGEEKAMWSFVISIAIAMGVAIGGWFVTRGRKHTLGTRTAFGVVVLSWVAAIVVGMLPFAFSGEVSNLIDCLFESTSGFTTTGASCLPQIDSLPYSINLWRCETHWLGGMGIIGLTVAILPILGIGGFQLIKAESTGPEKGKLTPKIANTAKILWFIYLALTVILFFSLRWAGMSLEDALAHAFATLGTGGFSTRGASIAAFNSAKIEWILILFMFLSSLNFALYYRLFTGERRTIFQNSEFKAFLWVLGGVIVLMISGGGVSVRSGIFHIVSIVSTTGFTTCDYATWNGFAQMLLFLLFMIGGCSGSTGGGVKMIRWVVMGKAFRNEVMRILHPHGIFTLRIDNRPAREEIIGNVSAFLFLYVGLVLATSFIGCLSGLDPWSSITGALSMVGNVGPAFGKLGPAQNCAELPSFLKGWYSFAMLAGRLELYTAILYFTRAFWVK